MGREPAVGLRMAENLGRGLGEVERILDAPEDFLLHDLAINVGLILWGA